MSKNFGFTNGPVQLSVIIASFLATGCSNMNFREGLFDSKSSYAQVEPEDVSPMSIVDANGGDFDKIDKTDPRFIVAEAAKIAIKEGNYASAMMNWDQLISQYPEYEPAYIGYAQAGRKTGAHQQVLVKLFDYKTRNAESADISMEIAKVFYELKDYNKALEEIDEAIEIQNDNWKLYSLRGVVTDKLNYPSEAEASYARALELSPDNPTILNNLAVSKMNNGSYNEAEYFVTKAMNDKKADIQVYRTYAKVLAMKGDLTKAEDLLTSKLNNKEEAQKVISSVKAEVSKPVLWGRK